MGIFGKNKGRKKYEKENSNIFGTGYDFIGCANDCTW
jgi:hypothetical protein